MFPDVRRFENFFVSGMDLGLDIEFQRFVFS
jgi:hypothetical protein